MKKQHKIVMLPTEDIGALLCEYKDGLSTNLDRLLPHNNKHLYILSDDEIKEGDYIYDSVINEVNKVFHGTIVIGQDRKIIATTDPKLQVDNVLDLTLEKFGKKHLPQIPKSLVEYYAKHQPEEVELEYDCQVKAINYGTKDKPEKVQNYDEWTTVGELSSYGLLGVQRREKLKLQNNEVVWVEPIKGQMALTKVNGTLQAETLYTSQEVERLTHNAFLAGALANAKDKDMGEYWKWKKKNL